MKAFTIVDVWLFLTFHQVLNRWKKSITGLSIPQEYVCVPLEDFQQPLKVFLSDAVGNFITNVTSRHLFLGYKPLIIALIFLKDDVFAEQLQTQESVELSFCEGGLKPEGPSFYSKHSLARLKLKLIKVKHAANRFIFFYTGEHGSHLFLSPLHQWANRLREALRKSKPGNVGLEGNLYDQIRIAYAVPRIISLITLGENNEFNIFPTDLHGPVGEEFYISSLRHGGKANAQVERIKKLVVSTIDVNAFRWVYSLGKNHMRDLRPLNEFNVATAASKNFAFPLPESVLFYRELRWIESFDVGIHRLHFYEVVHKEKTAGGLTLAHIHQYYAQWRMDKNIPTTLLIR